MKENSNITFIAESDVPFVDDAVRHYEGSENRGRLTYNSQFWIDPLEHRPDLCERRDELFFAKAVSYGEIFTDIISGNGQMFIDTVIYFHTLTIRLTQFL